MIFQEICGSLNPPHPSHSPAEAKNLKRKMRTPADDATVYEVAPLAFAGSAPPAGALYTLNATHRHCSCPVFSAHHLCCHLLLLPGAEDAVAAFDEGNTFPMHKRRRVQDLGDNFVEPTAGCSAGLVALHQLGAKHQRTSAGGEVSSLWGRLQKANKQLPPEKAALLAIKFKALVEESEAEVPAFTPTYRTQLKIDNRSSKKQAGRQEGDTSHKALEPRRRKKAAAPAALQVTAREFQSISKPRERRKRGITQTS